MMKERNPGRKKRGGPNKDDGRGRKSRNSTFSNSGTRRKKQGNANLIRLNKYIADAGVCSRREADKLIEAGAVRINGKIVSELGTKVRPSDRVQLGNETISREKKFYFLLNKPKGHITTTDDPQNRKTVMDLMKGACEERIYPVGRLDKDTTGLLLLTNDGDLAEKLMHPSHLVKKIYHATLNKDLTKSDMMKIIDGVVLEDGPVHVDKIAYVAEQESKNEVGIELHSGKNRVIRRLFESLGYKVIKLDRVMYAGLTKKNLPRGRWRPLSKKETGWLKMSRRS